MLLRREEGASGPQRDAKGAEVVARDQAVVRVHLLGLPWNLGEPYALEYQSIRSMSYGASRKLSLPVTTGTLPKRVGDPQVGQEVVHVGAQVGDLRRSARHGIRVG